MRLRNVLIYGIGIWFSLALVGYGIALRHYGSSLGSRVSEVIQGYPALQSHEGRITEAHLKWPHSRGVEFKMEGLDDPLIIPGEFIPSDAHWKLLEQYLRPGSKVQVKAQPENHWVMELQVNPKTVFQKVLIGQTSSAAQSGEHAKHVSVSAGFLIALGILILPLIFLIERYGKILLTGTSAASRTRNR